MHARWLADEAVWDVQVRDLAAGTTGTTGTTESITHDTAPFLINAQGRLSQPRMPAIPGLLTDFRGRVVHTAAWDRTLDVTGRRVAVIGNGSSGQQILPALLPAAAHIDHYVRSPVWIAPALHADADRGVSPASAANPGAHQYSAADRAAFAADPDAYLAYRRRLEAGLHRSKFRRNIRGSPENDALRRACLDTMLQRLGGSSEWLARLTPDFAPGCKRLTPGPGYLEALVHPDHKVSYIDHHHPLVRATADALVTADGVHRPVDIVVAATGFHSGFVPYFPTLGRNDVDLRLAWSSGPPLQGHRPGYPASYFGVMAADMPNYFFVLQAQSNGGGGAIPLQAELSATYIARVLRKMQLQRYRSITPKTAAVADFANYCLGHFQDKVVTDSCSSWLKAETVVDSSTNGAAEAPRSFRNVVWWPGSGHHRIQASLDPRWEDFDYERCQSPDALQNRYHYLGNGWTTREQVGGEDNLTAYLKTPDNIDLRSLHEDWFE